MGGDRFYTSSRWRKVRAAVLERDGGRCQIRGPHCRGTATQVDHVIPRAAGGSPLDPRNLRSVCAKCHSERPQVQRTRLNTSRNW